MKHLFILALVIVCCGTTTAQTTKPIQATTGSSVYELMFDSNNEAYMTGAVVGRIWINGKYNDNYADAYHTVLGKLTTDLKFEWQIELDETPYDAKMINDRIYILTRKDDEISETETYRNFIVDVYDLNGKWLANQEIYKIITSHHDASISGIITPDGFLVWVNWKDDAFVERFDTKLRKTLYSQTSFSFYGLDGTLQWQYAIEAGEGGFTDFRVQQCERDANGNTYIIGTFGYQCNTGLAEFTTEEMYPEYPSQPLHYNAQAMVKLNNEGEPVRSELFSENEVTVEDILFDGDGNMYVSGYHRGNNTFANAQEDARPYVGAEIRGEAFDYTEAMSENAPSDDGFICKLDTDWNLLWKVNVSGNGYNRLSKMILIDNTIHATGSFTDDMLLDGTTYPDATDNKGYSDGYYCTISTEGSVASVQLFTGEKSNLPELFVDANGAPVVAVGTKTNMTINGTYHEGYGYWGGEFLYWPR